MNDEAKQPTAVKAAAGTAQLIVAIALAIGGILLGVLVFAFSSNGRGFWQFFLESRVELRKVFWPNRQETFTTTLVVLVFVVIASLFFWVLDLTLASVTKFFTGQGS